jgi:heme exporter protein C
MKENFKLNLELLLTILVGILVLSSLGLIFIYVPNEKVMGSIQRIFYFHVGAAISCYFCFGAGFVSSLGFLGTKNYRWDSVNTAASEVGLLMCTITLVSGMIWARVAWNIWFRWEPRLVTFLLLWLISSSFYFTRKFGDPEKKAYHCAAISIIGALTVPLVWLSVNLAPQIAQLHPQVVEKGGLKDHRMVICLLVTVCAFIMFSILLIRLRTKIENLSQEISNS